MIFLNEFIFVKKYLEKIIFQKCEIMTVNTHSFKVYVFYLENGKNKIN